MINVFHIVCNKFFRVHFPFTDNEKIRNIFIVDGRDIPKKYENIKTGYELLKKEDVHFIEFSDSYSIIHLLRQLYKKDQPHVTIFSTFAKLELRDFVRQNGSKLFYINHGLLTQWGGNARITVWNNEYTRNYDRYFFTKFEAPYVIRAQKPPESVIPIGG
jgi:hypothetical protein